MIRLCGVVMSEPVSLFPSVMSVAELAGFWRVMLGWWWRCLILIRGRVWLLTRWCRRLMLFVLLRFWRVGDYAWGNALMVRT